MNRKIAQSKHGNINLALRIVVMLTLFVLPVSAVGSRSLAQSAMPGSNPFGVDFVKMLPDYGLAAMSQTDVRWGSGGDVLWSLVEPTEAARDWAALSEFDQELSNAQALGVEPIVTVRSTPAWAQKLPGVACGPIADAKLAAFGNFMFDLVNKYKDRVKYWEIWNEPDIDPDLVPFPDSGFGCWGDDTDQYYGGGQYAAMLKAVYPRIKQADPDAQVLVGGLLLDCDPAICTTNPAPRFLEGILKNGGASAFDGVAFHAYDYYVGVLGKYENANWGGSFDTTGPVLGAKADFIKRLLRENGAADKYILSTEVALLCNADCTADFENTKAYYLAQAYGTAYSRGLRAAMWYATLANWKFSDLLNQDLTGRPAYDAFQFGSAKLDGAQYWRKITPAAGVTGFEFSLTDRRIWLVWSLDGANHNLVLTEVPAAVYDVDGDPVAPAQSLVIGKEPYYIELSPGFQVLLPATLRQLAHLRNGDFELGLDASSKPYYWSFVSGGGAGLPASLQTVNPTVPYVDPLIPAGNYSALLGSSEYPCALNGVPIGYGAVEQSFYVPYVPDGTELELRFNYIIYTQDGSSSAVYDRFEVYITDSGNTTLAYYDGRTDSTVGCQYWYRIPATGWKTGVINLVTPVDYRGKTISVSFQNWNRADGWFNTFTYLDNVWLFDGD